MAVLGKTGRNFAAGMSGGLAYVFDEDGEFATRANTAMVSLEPVLTSAEQLAKVGSGAMHRGLSDEELLKKLLEDHHRWTGSKRARELLDTWAQSRLKFVKVFPLEYQRALKEMGQESANTQANANASPPKASKTSKAST